jgi:hypothetical protein
VRARRAALPFLLTVALWLAIAGALSEVTKRVSDWFVMTDELLYERLALSIVRLGTPLPHVHGESISNINQLYPMLLSLVFRHGRVLHGFHEAHVLNAFVITSTALPAYLLARRVTRHTVLPIVVAVATASVVWVTLASFLLTEVAAYPAFAWSILGLHVCLSRPSARYDLLAVAGIVLAVLARTQFYILAAILPLAIFGQAAAERRLREAAREHRALVGVYALGALAAIVLIASGHHVLGSYSQTAKGNPLPWEVFRLAPAHLAIVALAGGLLPTVIGGGWLVSNLLKSETRERQCFAWLAIVTIVLLTFEVSSFDVRFGGGVIRERYLFYLTPLLLTAMAAGLSAARPPRWSLAVSIVVLGLGFWQAPFPTFQKLNADTPASVLNDWLLSTMRGLNGTRVFLVLAAIVIALLYVEATAFVRRTYVIAAIAALLVVALPAETAYGFKRLFAVNGTSGLPMTLDQSVVFNWVDRVVGTKPETVMIPYPVLSSDYWANVGFWWDLEFWNRSVTREAGRPNEFSGTPPGDFPKIDLRFDPKTGRANVDLDAFVAQAVAETRFHIVGEPFTTQRNVILSQPERPWRADWVSYGLYDDGWTRPHQTARIRVFSLPKQKGRTLRWLTLRLLAPEQVPPRAVSIRSDAGSWHFDVTSASIQQQVSVCVPPHGYADLTVNAAGFSQIAGDPANTETFATTRSGGVQFQQIALADETGSC